MRSVLRATIVLHNLMRLRHSRLHNAVLDQERPNHQVKPGAWRADVNFLKLQPALGGRVNATANIQRNLNKLWCNSPVGSVDWQNNMTDR